MKKICSKCKSEKDRTEFRKDRLKSDGLQTFCKECAKSLQRVGYSERYGHKTRKQNQDRSIETQQKLNEIKSNSCCIFCAESDPACLDFHHTDSSTKEFGIGDGRSRSWKSILKEISKCVIVCSNCHRKIHNNKITLL